ncbi:MAG: hypothetical protein DMG19_11160 [Acidobacteria bacterium]|nr:MAG: hypothetical protein DMG19_11160 [Acidobacteriota bacterium]
MSARDVFVSTLWAVTDRPYSAFVVSNGFFSRLVGGIGHSLAQCLFAYEKAQAKFSFVGIAVEDCIELLTAEAANHFPLPSER